MVVSVKIREIVCLLGVWLVSVLYVATGQFADPDLWGRLSVAALYFQNGQFPYYDVFSYTAPYARWIDHEWLTGMVFYQLITRFGEVGFLLFKYGLILAIFYSLFRLHRKCYSVSPLYAFYGLLLTVGAYSVGLYATLRSQAFSFLLFVVFIYILERVRLGQRKEAWLWLLVPLGVIWGNLHGGFVMGLILLALYGVSAMRQAGLFHAGWRYWAVAALIFLSVGILNPYGNDYLGFLWHAWTLDRSHIGEWSAMKFELWEFLPGQLLVVGGVTIPLLRWWLRDKSDRAELGRLLTPILVLLWLSGMVIKGVRFQPFLALGAVAYVPLILSPEFLNKHLPRPCLQFFQKQASAFQNTLPALLLIMALSATVFAQHAMNLLKVPIDDEMTQSSKPEIRYPLGAILFLEHSPYHGNLSVRYGYGEFTYWRLYPRFKVSMDGRYEEVYSQTEFLRNDAFYDMNDVMRAQRATANIEHGPADFILAEIGQGSISTLLRSRIWQLLYTDTYFLVLGRKSTLQYYPTHQLIPSGLNNKMFSIGDMVTPADLSRFRFKN